MEIRRRLVQLSIAALTRRHQPSAGIRGTASLGFSFRGFGCTFRALGSSFRDDSMKEPTTNPEEAAWATSIRSGEVSSPSGNATVDPVDRCNLFDNISQCEIDPDARQKYTLIRLQYDGRTKYLVRGSRHALYHVETADPCIQLLRQSGSPGLEYKVLGGGRIIHDGNSKTIEIYGHSYGFPWRNGPRHDLTQQVVEEAFPGFTVSVSNSGY